EERARFVEGACDEDAALRRELQALLDSNDEADSFLIGALPVDAGTALLATTPTARCDRCEETFPTSRRFCPNCGDVLADDVEALVGSTLDGIYLIES